MPKNYYGKDCPEGMVQVEFVGVDPALKAGNYGYRPSESAFLEIYVDGERFRIDVGNVVSARDGTVRRGLHVIGPLGLEVDHHSLNAFDVLAPLKARRGGHAD